jgi:hypothetical protein
VWEPDVMFPSGRPAPGLGGADWLPTPLPPMEIERRAIGDPHG